MSSLGFSWPRTRAWQELAQGEPAAARLGGGWIQSARNTARTGDASAVVSLRGRAMSS